MDTQSLLTENELIIEKGQQTFIQVGLALMRIRDGKLYSQPTFAQYLRERWPLISVPHSYHLMSAASVVQNLQHNDPPATSTVAHKLAIIPPASQVEAWELAKLRSDTPSSGIVQLAAREVYVRNNSPALYDSVTRGDVGVNQAYNIAKRMKNLPPPVLDAIAIHGYPTESGLNGLLALYRFSPEEFDDLVASGRLQDGKNAITFRDLTDRDVENYINELKRGERIVRLLNVSNEQKQRSPAPILDGYELYDQLPTLTQANTMLYWFPDGVNTLDAIRKIQEQGGTVLFVSAYFNNPLINFSGRPTHPRNLNSVKPQAICDMIEQLSNV